MKHRVKKLLKKLHKVKGPKFIIADGIRYPINKEAVQTIKALMISSDAVTKEALKILNVRHPVRYEQVKKEP